jgi:hypothetical protein
MSLKRSFRTYSLSWLLVPHILLRFQSVIHCYGGPPARLSATIATTLRRRFGWIKAPAGSRSTRTSAPSVAVIEDDDSEFVRVRRRNRARLIQTI